MKLVLDATPLIYLVKSGFHSYFRKLGVDFFTTEEVINELRLDEDKYPENSIITQMIGEGIIRVLKPKEKLPAVKGIHTGELSVIALAMEMGGIVIMDDKKGKIYARTFGIKSFHSTFLIFYAVRKGILSKEKARKIIDCMIDSGCRCDIETYRNILRILDGIKSGRQSLPV